MKHDVFSWKEVKPNEKTQAQGRLQLRVSAPASLYVSALGVESLVGVSTTFDVDFSEAVDWYIDGAVRVFVHVAAPTSGEGDYEQYTNIDRQPDENPALAAVTHALRRLEFDRRNMLFEMRALAPSQLELVAPSADDDQAVIE